MTPTTTTLNDLLPLIKKTISNGGLQSLHERERQTANEVASLDPRTPGYAWQVAQRSLEAATAHAKVEGYEQAFREIFGMLEAAAAQG